MLVVAERLPVPEPHVACCIIQGVKQIVVPAKAIDHAINLATTAINSGADACVNVYPIC